MASTKSSATTESSASREASSLREKDSAEIRRLHCIVNEAIKNSEANSDSEVANTLKNIFATEQKLHRNHSFQLVRLQSEVHSLKAQREQDVKEMEDMRQQMRLLYTDLANMKGMIGRLTMDAHIGKREPLTIDTAAAKAYVGRSAKSSASLPPSDVKSSGPDDYDAKLLNRVRGAGRDMDELADRILREEREQLVKCLKGLQVVANHLSPTVSASTGASSAQRSCSGTQAPRTPLSVLENNCREEPVSAAAKEDHENKENVPPCITIPAEWRGS